MISKPNVNPWNGLAATSLAFGITPILPAVAFLAVGSFWGLATVVIAALSSFMAIITGAASLRQIKKQGGRGKNMAIIGITLGLLTVGSVLLVILFVLSLFGAFGGKGI